MLVLGMIRLRHLPRCTLRLCVKLSDPLPPAFPLVSHLPYALPSSVSCKSFACHSWENCRGVYQQFPFWFTQSAVGGTLRCPLIIRHSTQALCFHILAHSLTRPKTQLFSFPSLPHSLLENTGGEGTSATFKRARASYGRTRRERERRSTTDLSLLRSSAWFPAVPGRAVPPIGHASPSSQSKPGGLYP
jgi:hypothetical protein